MPEQAVEGSILARRRFGRIETLEMQANRLTKRLIVGTERLGLPKERWTYVGRKLPWLTHFRPRSLGVGERFLQRWVRSD